VATPNENRNGGAGGPREWPDRAGDYLYQFSAYYSDLKRSLRSAAFLWDEAGPDERAAYLDEFAKLREKEQRAYETYLARPITKGP
jgi:hypothetical protein